MKIDIQALHFSLTESLRNYAERRLHFSLAACDGHIVRVVMRLSDLNAARGAENKHCHLQVVLAGLPDVVIGDTQADIYVAINRATDWAGRTVVRKINRQQTLLKQGNCVDSVIDDPVNKRHNGPIP